MKMQAALKVGVSAGGGTAPTVENVDGEEEFLPPGTEGWADNRK